jgi:phytoene dehydrogenase-like protein
LTNPDVLIVGGGLSGLCCARRLSAAGISCRIYEASDDVGGRARTDEVDGFLLDRGFQVLLTSYPEARQVLDYPSLQLGRFEPGALVRYQGKFHRFVDPLRRPSQLLATALSPVASFRDKLRVARLRRNVCRSSIDQLLARPETTTIDSLRREGFSDRIVERFFRPFLGGVFLDRELKTSSRMFAFVFRMFATGDAALPAQGMAAIARQIAGQLPEGTVQTGVMVDAVEADRLLFKGGETVCAEAIVVACEAPAAARLLGQKTMTDGRGVTCLYFAADRPPIDEPILVLNGDRVGPVNNLCVPSQVTPSYAPPNQSLISVSVLSVPGDNQHNLELEVRAQLRDWFGPVVEQWRHLRSYFIPYALPDQTPPALSPVAKPARRTDGVFVCGDYLDTASIQGAMVSGRRAAEEIIDQRLK